jgi:hypothetical protein
MQDNFVCSPWGIFVLPNKVCFFSSESFSGPQEITLGVQHAPGYSSIPARSFGWFWEKCPATGPAVFESFPNGVESSKNSLYPLKTPLQIGLKPNNHLIVFIPQSGIFCQQRILPRFSLCPDLLNQMADLHLKSSMLLESPQTNFTGKSQRPLLG